MDKPVKYSYSAVNTLRMCNRKYYFSSILASHGRKSPLRRKAYELKHMQDLKMWQGSVVDKAMEKIIIPAISQKQALDFDSFANQAVALADRQFKFSQFGIYRDASVKKGETADDFCILDIHELGKPYSQEELQNAYRTIRQAILGIPFVQMPDGKSLVEFLTECSALAPNVTNRAVTIETAVLAPQIDLIAYHNWKPVVIDWKLSASYSSDYSRQLMLCGITIYLKRLESLEKKPFEFADITLYEVNLLSSSVKQHDFCEQQVNELIDYVALTSRDIVLLNRREIDGQIDIEGFEFTDDEGHCKLCNFRPLCAYVLYNQDFDESSYTKFVQDQQFV